VARPATTKQLDQTNGEAEREREITTVFGSPIYLSSVCGADPLACRLADGVTARRKARAVVSVGSYSGSESQSMVKVTVKAIEEVAA
jgi:hypothetical protein